MRTHGRLRTRPRTNTGNELSPCVSLSSHNGASLLLIIAVHQVHAGFSASEDHISCICGTVWCCIHRSSAQEAQGIGLRFYADTSAVYESEKLSQQSLLTCNQQSLLICPCTAHASSSAYNLLQHTTCFCRLCSLECSICSICESSWYNYLIQLPCNSVPHETVSHAISLCC